MLCGGSGPLCRLQGPHPLASAPAPSLPPLFILSVIISSCLVSAVLNPITPSPEEGVGSCSAGTAQGLSPVETLRALGGPWSLQGPRAPHKWAQDWGPCARTPCLALGKTPNPCPWSPPLCRAPKLHGVLHPTVTPGPSCWPHGHPTPQRAGNGVPAPTPDPPLAPCTGPCCGLHPPGSTGGPLGGTLVPPPPPPHYGAAPQLAPPAQQQGRGGVSGLPPPRGRATSM